MLLSSLFFPVILSAGLGGYLRSPFLGSPPALGSAVHWLLLCWLFLSKKTSKTPEGRSATFRVLNCCTISCNIFLFFLSRLGRYSLETSLFFDFFFVFCFLKKFSYCFFSFFPVFLFTFVSFHFLFSRFVFFACSLYIFFVCFEVFLRSGRSKVTRRTVCRDTYQPTKVFESVKLISRPHRSQ